VGRPAAPRPATPAGDRGRPGLRTGSLALLLAADGYRVLGLDVSGAMLAVARRKVEAAGPAVEFVQGDASSPPCAEASCDVVLSRHVLWALPDPDAALARWVPLLKPGGRLILIEGRWSTGAGLTSQESRDLVLHHRREATVTPLSRPALWAHPIEDERYLLVSRR
jgi:ubiquinone/menaquinone biosynthesis C-methylase UbiE